MLAVKTLVKLKSINATVIDKVILEFYTCKEPTKVRVMEQIEKMTGMHLSNDVDDMSLFYSGEMYITYTFEQIEILGCVNRSTK